MAVYLASQSENTYTGMGLLDQICEISVEKNMLIAFNAGVTYSPTALLMVPHKMIIIIAIL